MDLSTVSVSELRALQTRIEAELKSRKKLELAKAREQILSIAQSAGISLKDLTTLGSNEKAALHVVRFRSADGKSNSWSGRGRQPKWVKAWLEDGKPLDALRA